MAIETRTVVGGIYGRKHVQNLLPCAHKGCKNKVWCSVGMPGHPCCDGCFEKVHVPAIEREMAAFDAGLR